MAGDTDQVGFFAGERLAERAQRDPNKVALICRDRKMTFSDANIAADNLAFTPSR